MAAPPGNAFGRLRLPRDRFQIPNAASPKCDSSIKQIEFRRQVFFGKTEIPTIGAFSPIYSALRPEPPHFLPVLSSAFTPFTPFDSTAARTMVDTVIGSRGRAGFNHGRMRALPTSKCKMGNPIARPCFTPPFRALRGRPWRPKSKTMEVLIRHSMTLFSILFAALFRFTFFIFFTFANAASAAAQPREPKITDQGARRLDGGIGLEERAAMKEVTGFNLKLVFAGDQGKYIANVAATIKDADGNQLLPHKDAGPRPKTDLPKESYRAGAAVGGEPIRKPVRIGDGVGALNLTWQDRKPPPDGTANLRPAVDSAGRHP